MMFVKKNQVQLPLNIAYHQMGKRGQGTTGLLCPKTEEEWLTMMTQVCEEREGGDGFLGMVVICLMTPVWFLGMFQEVTKHSFKIFRDQTSPDPTAGSRHLL